MNIICRAYHRVFLGKIDLEELNKQQRELTEMNVVKHTKIFFSTALVMIYTWFIINNFYINDIAVVMTALLGILFISGTAWFAITFGAIPAKFIEFAVQITAWLFSAFAFSLSAVFIAACISLPLLTPMFFVTFFACYGASVKYDVVDALKLGIDETIYKHAQVGRTYFIRELKNKK